jgi:hypothetical protein
MTIFKAAKLVNLVDLLKFSDVSVRGYDKERKKESFIV